ncbi:HAD hydrolase-like protein [Terriglobus saanensis]|uniref:HAD-superfamily hydrolase, subfamily IA, variant 1 n=1 Tax=Terriglobus saanensis (strain ATCC BAA-1853 / DSM 23119 / SP1PR4) TaxID=401053 RepID=E8V699_TERSS|nr:HAD hydrolase-like protein [Terriglobus saanensis]ADV81564.1 HAD-superfamily hydrolase, subfamily IA, variant 1 [Terriglobus saanensis SP1PR4]
MQSIQQKLIIFDFDGTLADTFDLFAQTFDFLASSYRFKPFDRENGAHLRTLHARAILAYHQVPMWKLPAITLEMRKLMAQDIDKVRLFPGMEEVLKYLAQHGARLALLSSNSQDNVLRVLGHETAKLFLHIECGTSIFGKRSKLKKLLKTTGFQNVDTILIGDEIRDCEAAKQLEIPFGGVAWGYNDPDVLAQAGAQWIFAEASDLASRGKVFF